MASFNEILRELSSIKTSLPFVVEVVFVDSSCPEKGMSSYVGSYETFEQASSVASRLSMECAHDFLTFRARQTGKFYDFYTDEGSTVLTDDEKFNKAILIHQKTKREHIEKEERKKKVMERQMEREYEPGTVENVSRLIHLCAKNEKRMKDHENAAVEAKRDLKKRISELVSSIRISPSVVDEWYNYIEPLLIEMGESPKMISDWWKENGDSILQLKE